jgi:Winged helix DNA-binding domain
MPPRRARSPRWNAGGRSGCSKVAFHLALDGRIGRDRPRGTWISGQFRWSPVERWLPDGIRELPVDAARADLVRRWLLTFGPGTRDDIAWWTGWGSARRGDVARDTR